jgi:uncharacterized protein involved in type VI secretion and phage assembly
MNTRPGTRKTLCLLTFAALGAMSASAFSQSAEFGRGYEQGYRDGFAAAQQGARYQQDSRYQQEGQNQRGRRGGRLAILEAFYGLQGASCDARDVLQRAAEGQRQIQVPINNQLCGDPAVGRTKQFFVTYQCGSNRAQRVVKNEGDTLTLQCG